MRASLANVLYLCHNGDNKHIVVRINNDHASIFPFIDRDYEAECLQELTKLGLCARLLARWVTTTPWLYTCLKKNMIFKWHQLLQLSYNP